MLSSASLKKLSPGFQAAAKFLFALPIRVHLFLLVLIAISPALAAILYLGAAQREDVYENARHEALETANLMALVLERKTENARQLLVTLARLPQVRSDPGSLTPLLTELLETHGDYLNLLVADTHGNVVASGVPASGKNVGDRKYFKDAVNTRGFAVGEYSVGRIMGQPTFHFAYPVLDERRNVMAVVAGAFNLHSFAELFRKAGLPAGSELVLDDHNGTVLFAAVSRNSPVGKQDTPEMVALLSGALEQGILESAGPKRVLGFQRLRLGPDKPPYLLVRVAIPPAIPLKKVNKVIRICLILFAAASVLAIATSSLLGNLLVVQRLRVLLGAANSIKRGEFQARTGLEPSPGEIGRLAQAFDDMAEALEEHNSAQQRIQIQLRASEERYKHLIDTMLNGFSYNQIVCDAQDKPIDWKILEVNRAFQSLLGISREEALGRTGRQLFADLEPCWLENFGHVAITGEPRHFQGYVKAVGRYFDTFTYCPAPLHFAVLFNDITERKRAERALLEEKERLAVTLASIGDGVITTDREGRILLMSQVAEEYTGFSLSEAQGLVLSDIVQFLPDGEPKPGLLGNEYWHVPTRATLRSRHGTERLVSSLAAPILDDRENVSGTVVVLRDITAENRIQEELQRSSKLESVGVMAGGIAHDFNNLLSAICGNLSLVEASMGATCGSKVQQMLSGMENAIGRARELTQQLLTFAKGGDPVKSTIGLTKLVRSSAQFILSGSAHNLEFEAPADLWPVEADEGQVSQVVNNLVINAVQAMRTAGTIKIRLENFKATKATQPALKGGLYVKVSVKDQGGGVGFENLPRIFDPFFTTKPHGTGLGLTSAYSIIKAHGGRLEIEETSAKGSTFSFYLPATPKADVKEPRPKPSIAGTSSKRILIMDDEPVLRSMLVEMLTLLGHRPVAVCDGLEAITVYREHKELGHSFDLVILDLTIRGGLGGKDTMRRLLENDQHAMGIASSGYSTDAVMSDFRNFGFANRLVKPFNLDELKRVIAETVALNEELVVR